MKNRKKNVVRKLFAFALCLALLLTSTQAMAEEPSIYLSEVKVGYGESGKEAAAALDGYTILKNDSGGYADLNEGGSSTNFIQRKGTAVVYLGYKTTMDPAQAITDLSVMNMNGGFSISKYTELLDSYRDNQVRPFIDHFKAAFAEYRENYQADNSTRQIRAQVLHDVMNTVIEDDSGMPVGDLFLNPIREEMDEAAYDALPDEDKKKHADLSKMIIEGNDEIIAMMEKMVILAADTAEDTWLDRMQGQTLEQMLDRFTADGTEPADAMNQMAVQYEDTAKKLAEKWEEFRMSLVAYQLQYPEDAEAEPVGETVNPEEFISRDGDDIQAPANSEEAIEKIEKITETLTEIEEIKTEGFYHYLKGNSYGDGTLLDFFLLPVEEVSGEEISRLYPLAASLSAGQAGGLDLLSMRDLINIAMSPNEAYEQMEEAMYSLLDTAKEISLYSGVNRELFRAEVALTSETMRKDPGAILTLWQAFKQYNQKTFSELLLLAVVFNSVALMMGGAWLVTSLRIRALEKLQAKLLQSKEDYFSDEDDIKLSELKDNLPATRGLAIIFIGVAIVYNILTIITMLNRMSAYYHPDFSPIPKYMVDEKDITTTNDSGQKIFVKNLQAYYEAARCNRTSASSDFEKLQDYADLNGDVGREWVALYTCMNPALGGPILANSLKVVTGNNAIPEGYSKAISKFGSSAAFNMTDAHYTFNDALGGIYVYYKTGTAAAPVTGSTFGTGALALASCGGVVAGAALTAFGMTAGRKKKEDK